VSAVLLEDPLLLLSQVLSADFLLLAIWPQQLPSFSAPCHSQSLVLFSAVFSEAVFWVELVGLKLMLMLD
jgi:hypothetical protein